MISEKLREHLSQLEHHLDRALEMAGAQATRIAGTLEKLPPPMGMHECLQ